MPRARSSARFRRTGGTGPEGRAMLVRCNSAFTCVTSLTRAACVSDAEVSACGERAETALEGPLEVERRGEAASAQVPDEADRSCRTVEEPVRRSELPRQRVPGEQDRLVEVGMAAE